VSGVAPEAKTAMEKTSVQAGAGSADLPEALLLDMYRKIYATRRFEQRCVELYRQGLIRGYFHPSLGQEAVAAGACTAVGPEGYVVSTHRGHGHSIAKGADLKPMVAELLGKEAGYCRGRGGSMHIANYEHRNLGANGIVGGGIPIATGAAMGVKLRQEQAAVLCFLSDGASNNGVFGESMNLAAIFDLPVIYLLENNHYAVSTPIASSTRIPDLARRADGYGVPSAIVDGNDAVAVYRETRAAVARALRGEGPTLIEAKTYRHGGHHVNDPGAYMDQEALAKWKARDPLTVLGAQIPAEAKLEAIRDEVEAELEAAITFAKQAPEPDVDEFIASLGK
jgi:TPP-dependent pyruvate/acetoin dehydrogenase alpha subunit